MEIKWPGERTVVIKSKKETVVVNPEKADFWAEARIVVYTDSSRSGQWLKDKLLVSGPGEYEAGGVVLWGTKAGEGVMVVIEADGLRIGLMPELKEDLKDKKIEKIGSLDVLMVYLPSLETKKILGLAKTWGVNYLVPIPGKDESKLSEFLDEADIEGQEAVDQLNAVEGDLPDGLEIVLLKNSLKK